MVFDWFLETKKREFMNKLEGGAHLKGALCPDTDHINFFNGTEGWWEGKGRQAGELKEELLNNDVMKKRGKVSSSSAI